jgi:DNA-directed RNA polymerase sigma subunit (sigma70/sigma32)
MSTISLMLESASRYPIPSKAEQIHLGTAIQRGLQPDATPREKRAGDRACRRLVEGNIRLAISVAKPYLRRLQGSASMGLEDLIQEAVIGLHTAARKFDPTRGYSFTTMGTWWCRQAVARAVQMQAATIRMPTHQLDLVRRWRYRPTDQDLASFCEQYGYTPEQVEKTLAMNQRASVRSLDAPLSSAAGSSWLETVASPSGEPCLDGLDLAMVAARLEAVLPAETELVARWAGGQSRREIAATEGISHQGVGHRLEVARKKLRAVAGPDALALLAETA